VFKGGGAKVTLASPLGGQPPIDPNSDAASAQTDATRRFKDDASAQVAFSNTRKLRDINATDFDAVFYPGGHGTLWDLAENGYSMTLLETMLGTGKPVGLVCHAPGALRHVIGSNGNSIIKGRSVTGFSNTEEKAAGLLSVVPFLVEDMLRENGGHYTKAGDWLPFVVTDGLLITGQNPASSASASAALLAVAELHKADRREPA
jgi:putative intracellular protease/amidase